MKKFYAPILIVQFVLMVMFLIYALVQRTQVIKQREIAVQAETIAQENEKRAIELQKLAEMAHHQAMQQAELARQALEACEKKKK